MKNIYSSITKAGLIAGTLDICAAMLSVYIRNGIGPEPIFRYIARAAFGDAARTGGTEYIIAGILFHYLIAFGFTILFFLVYPKIKRWVSPNIVIAGLIYGVIVWCIMNLVVVPSTFIGMTKFSFASVTREMLILMCCIGLPVALLSKKHYQ